MPEPLEQNYKVEHSQDLLAKVKAWTEKCARLELSDRLIFVNALKTILHKLQTSPQMWGEQERSLPHKGLPIYHGVCSILSVHYTVLEEQRTVVLQDIVLLPSFPLEAGPDENA